MVPSIEGLLAGKQLKEEDGFVLSAKGADELIEVGMTLKDADQGRIPKEGDILKVLRVRRGSIVVSTPFERGWTAISRRDHDWFSARASEQEMPSRKER